MPSIADRVKETTTTTGTGTVSLEGAVVGFRAFSSAFTTGTVVYYCITDGTAWEVGYGAVTTGTPWTLARTTVLASSNAGSLVSFGAGSKDVFCTAPSSAFGERIQPISASVAGNALTLTLNPTALDFRSATLGSGTISTREISSAASLVISSGSTLGTVSAIQSRIVVLAIDNAGTVELAAVNISGGNDLSETGLISTTAEGGAGAADSANVIYSTTGRTDVAYRVVGYVESTQATAGTWATAPSTIQGYGGQVNIVGTSMVRLNTANGYGSTNTKIRRFTNIVTNQGSDITYADSATLGASFTINANGVYAISYADDFTDVSRMGISLNSTQLTTAIYTIDIADVLAFVTTPAAGYDTTAQVTAYLPVGSIIRPHASGLATGTGRQTFTITRVL